MIRVLDLFSGIGGFSLGLKRAGGFRTVCYVENEPYCQEVLLHRMSERELDPAPIHSDIREFDGKIWFRSVDLITGGFPCQDISLAGKGEGIDGKRSGLWKDFARIIGKVRPRFVLVENVPALLARGMGTVLGDLASLGYDAEWDCIPACALGAPHRRDRVWIVAADAERARLPANLLAQGRAFNPRAEGPAGYWSSWWLHESPRQHGRWVDASPEARAAAAAWEDAPCEPVVLGLPDGVSRRMDRIKATGNAVVPQVVEWLGGRIREALTGHKPK